jgi:hypothetical protein
MMWKSVVAFDFVSLVSFLSGTNSQSSDSSCTNAVSWGSDSVLHLRRYSLTLPVYLCCCVCHALPIQHTYYVPFELATNKTHLSASAALPDQKLLSDPDNMLGAGALFCMM